MPGPVRAATDLRLLRAGMFSAVCVGLSTIGHVSASGMEIPWWAVAVGWGAVTAIAVPLAGRERHLPGIAVVLLAGQLGLHLLFCLAQAAAARAAEAASLADLGARLLCTDSGSHPAASIAAQLAQQAGLPTPPVPQMAAMGGWDAVTGSFTASMLGVHVAAAVMMGWVLRRGEMALWRTVRLSARVADRVAAAWPMAVLLGVLGTLALLAGLVRRVGAACAVWEVAGPARPGLLLRSCVIRRGPPCSAPAV
ncbi:hypothetical protein LN042_28560 [Kitasatospora sp. RB6PN24]|uniref:hypothetical protein n=1 Tax=Kitasatospora humi TaxID=2893891 RepID=UPI001E4D7434|nr:hypothetical protein [Kitasatospora humi]MCC9310975.1 hypothetical protein [Kitasatospora humi]